jgi:hypothetical protein
MGAFLWLGSGLGAVLGLLHGVYLYRRQTARAVAGGVLSPRAVGFYYGLWAFALWTFFGSYVLAFWVLGAVAYWTMRFATGRRTAR